MKPFLLLAVFFLSATALSQEAEESAQMSFSCEQSAIATDDDQQMTALEIAFGKYKMNPRIVGLIETSSFSAWKDMSVESSHPSGCVRNVEQQYLLNIRYFQERPEVGFEVCERKSVVRIYKHFVTDSTQDIAERAYWLQCEPMENPDQVGVCAEVQCEPEGKLSRFPDVFNNCSCRTLYDMVKFERLGRQYSGFFIPGRFEQAPFGTLPYSEFIQSVPLSR